jgi:hypothetical protein
MKTKLTLNVATVLLSLLTLMAQLSTAHAQGTAFTYQGRLNDGASPANGIYDLRFTIYASTNSPGTIVAGPFTNSAVAVSNGLFTTALDFGAGVFAGNPRWLEISVQKNGGGFTPLSPRQQLTATPYAILAASANSLISLVVQQNANGAPNMMGGSPNNFVSTGVIGVTIGGGGATNYVGVA